MLVAVALTVITGLDYVVSAVRDSPQPETESKTV
jgi:hypothetical protein